MLSLPTKLICGSFDCREFGDLTYSPKRTVQMFEIEFFMEDGFFVYSDDKVFPIRKHHIHLKHPGQVCYSKLPFRTMFLKFSAEGELAQRLLQAEEYFPCSQPEKAAALLSKIILLHEQGDDSLALYEAVLSFLMLVLTDGQGSDQSVIARSKEFMERHYAQGITLDDIAKSVNLSSIYFHNLFSAAVGMSPHRWLTGLRIAESKKLLWNSQISISEVAERCGFGCQQYFSRVFKKETAMTPGQYRRQAYHNYLK